MAFDVTFWGVRGTVPCPSRDHIEVGGNTSCVEVSVGGRTLILDGGTGLRPLGKRLVEKEGGRLTILLSHFHLDHIAGFPFFAPAFRADFTIDVRAACPAGKAGLRAVLSGQMEPPLFPVPLRDLEAAITFEEFRPGDRLDLGDGVVVRTAPLNHPDGCTGFRIEHGGHALAYVTDTEHVPGRPDENVLRLIDGADLVIYDAAYTDEEWSRRKGWGHSTWREGVRLCRTAQARRLALFHHDPDHDDIFMARLEHEVRAEWPAAFVAREGMTVELGAAVD